MAEAIAIVSLVATVGSLVDYGRQIVSRLNEFHSDFGEVPKSLRDFSNILPLILDTLSRTERQARDGRVNHDTQVALRPVLQDCRTQIKALELILQKTLPTKSDSAFTKSTKALASVRKQKDINKIVSKIRDHVSILTYHHSTGPNMPSVVRSHANYLFTVPFPRDEKFIGREQAFASMKEQLQKQRRMALSGIGGVGKSQIAIEYCYRFRDEFPESHVLWIYSNSSSRIRQSYDDIARDQQLPGWKDPKVDMIRLVNEWLSSPTSRRWLLVFDNVDDLKVLNLSQNPTTSGPVLNLAQALPLPHNSEGSVVITTRDRNIGEMLVGLEACVVIPQMTPEEATALLVVLVGLDAVTLQKQIVEILEFIEYLPLAVAQAAAFMIQNGVTLIEYLDMLRSNKTVIEDLLDENLGDRRRDTESSSSVFRTWRISFDLIREQKPKAADLLSLMAMLDRQMIPESLLVAEGSINKLEMVTSLGMLKGFSLIHVVEAGSSYEMHRLVQLATQRWLQSRMCQDFWQGKAIQVVSDAFPFGYYDNWPTCAKLLPHAQVVTRYEVKDVVILPALAALLHRKASFDATQGRFDIAEQNLTISFHMHTSLYGLEDQKTIESMFGLGYIYSSQARFEAAEDICSRALRYSRNAFGDHNLVTLSAMSQLADVYRLQSKPLQAEELLLKAIAGTGGYEALEPHLFEVMQCRQTLGDVYLEQERWKEAEAIFESLLETKKAYLGVDHPEVLNSKRGLSHAYTEMGRYAEAENMLYDVLTDSRRLLGPESGGTIASEYRLALNLAAQGRQIEAMPIMERVVEVSERTMGETHTDTLNNMGALAMLHVDLGHWSEADALGLRVFEISKSTHGSQDVSTLATMGVRAYSFYQQQRLDEAEALQSEAMESMKTTLGLGHRCTQKAMQLLSDIYHAQGNWAARDDLDVQLHETQPRVARNKQPVQSSIDEPDKQVQDPPNEDEISQRTQLGRWIRSNHLGKRRPSRRRRNI